MRGWGCGVVCGGAGEELEVAGLWCGEEWEYGDRLQGEARDREVAGLWLQGKRRWWGFGFKADVTCVALVEIGWVEEYSRTSSVVAYSMHILDFNQRWGH